MVKAASKIQAGFRSKQTRDILKQYKTALDADFTDSSSEEDSDDDVFDADAMEEVAATKIQAGFRGQQARKSVKEMKEGILENNAAEGSTTESSKYTPGYFELHGIESECMYNTFA